MINLTKLYHSNDVGSGGGVYNDYNVGMVDRFVFCFCNKVYVLR